MKKAGNIAFGAIMSALCVVVMLGSHFLYLTYAIPPIAAMFIMVVVIELGTRWAFATYVAASVITILFAEPESALFFVLIFGYYPIIKVPIERLHSRLLRLLCKLGVFNAAVAAIYFVFLRLMGIDSGYGGYSLYLIGGIWVIANAIFFLYDAQIIKLSNWYMVRFHDRVQRYLKKR